LTNECIIATCGGSTTSLSADHEIVTTNGQASASIGTDHSVVCASGYGLSGKITSKKVAARFIVIGYIT
jgi:hypothetical protein